LLLRRLAIDCFHFAAGIKRQFAVPAALSTGFCKVFIISW
jgi:hypothetical protein